MPFRLTGLAAVGSTPTTALGLALLISLAAVKYVHLRLSVGYNSKRKEVNPMTKTDKLTWCSLLEAVTKPSEDSQPDQYPINPGSTAMGNGLTVIRVEGK